MVCCVSNRTACTQELSHLLARLYLWYILLYRPCVVLCVVPQELSHLLAPARDDWHPAGRPDASGAMVGTRAWGCRRLIGILSGE